MVKQMAEMTDEELFAEFRAGNKYSPKYDKYLPEMQIRQAKAQMDSARATQRSVTWIFWTMVIIGISNAIMIWLQVKVL